MIRTSNRPILSNLMPPILRYLAMQPGLFLILVARRRDPGVREEYTQLLDQVPVADIALVGVVQEFLETVEFHMEA